MRRHGSLLPVACLILCLRLAGLPTAAGAGRDDAYDSLAELEASISQALTSGEVDPFWSRVIAHGRMPLVFGRTAVFFYRGKADTVEWRGDFSEWWDSWDTLGERLGDTDIYRKTVQLLPGSRLDYKLVIDGGNWLLDPLNSQQQLGGFGPNSESRMPDWQPSEWVTRKEGTPRGSFSEDTPIASKKLGYSVNVRVYAPAGLDEKAGPLPTLYVTDGSDYYHDEMGSLVIVLDNLVAAKRIHPLIAVFIDPWDRSAQVNRRPQELIPQPGGECAFCDFIVEELVPHVDSHHPTKNTAEHRAILGTSLGGLHATYMGLTHPDVFGAIAVQSPAFRPAPFVLDQALAAEKWKVRAFLDIGLYEKSLLGESRRLAKKLESLGVDHLYLERPEGHSWGHWRATLDDALMFLFPP